MPRSKKSSRRSVVERGLEYLLSTPASPMTREGLQAFREMKKASGMNTQDLLSYIGKKAHTPRSAENDKSKQEKRLAELE